MAYVKLDCGILDSTLWYDRDAREIFLTALLMASPGEVVTPTAQIAVRSLEDTGWLVPPGWYGLVAASGLGIIHRAGIEDQEAGVSALERLGSPETASRTQDHEGRRLVRIDGGYCVLNFMRYRDRDHTAAVRSRRYRERKKERHAVAGLQHTVASRNVTQAVSSKQEAEAKPTTTSVALARHGDGKPARTFTAIQAHLAGILAEVSDGTQQRIQGEEVRTVQAELVFAYWAAKMGHEGTRLDDKRLRRLMARLRENEGDVHELLYVVDGARRDPNLQGQNARGTTYDGIETLFRDRGQVERLAGLVKYTYGKPHPMAVKYLEPVGES